MDSSAADREVEQLRAEVARLRAELERAERELSDQRGLEAAPRAGLIPLHSLPLAAVRLNNRFEVLDWNQAAERLFGYTREEMLGRRPREWNVEQENRQRACDIEAQLAESSEPWKGLFPIVTKEGRRLTCQFHCTPLCNEAGDVVEVVSLAHDVTDREQLARELQEATARWQALMECAPEFIVVTDCNLRIEYINRLSPGQRWEDVVGADSLNFVRPEYHALVRSTIDHTLRTGEPGYYEVLEIPGDRWFGIRVGPVRRDGEIVSLISICNDITQFKQQQAELEESRQRLEMVLEQLPGIIWTTDRQLAFTSGSGVGLNALDETPETLVGQTLFEFFETEDVEFEPIAQHLRALAGETTTYEVCWKERDFQATLRPLQDDRGELQGVVGVAVDITALKQAQRIVAEANEQLESRVRERTAELDERNTDLRRERRLLLRLLELQRRERDLVSYEIHDGIVQMMTAASMFLGTVKHKLGTLTQNHVPGEGEPSPYPPELAENLETAHRLVREATQEGRRLIEGLRPPILEAHGLVPAIGALIDEIHHYSAEPIEVVYEHHVQFGRVAPAVELAVYRIVQEGLSNVRKHSRASRALVRLEQQGSDLLITVRDWGVGFDTKKVRAKHYGLVGVEERARLLDGQSVVTSNAGEGTTLWVRLPLVDALLPRIDDPDLDET